ncbi:heavy-metal-associated domain-containing protein [Agromyces lapidis]|uniref:Heavy-metal-associated domain-containing protein n=1 Tax=Agromyces lapidis TaxID=279574 RepID=A0ABV5SX03_9MICO|nr:heavy-metal-associated domain-containing protein [Agromyces lapidis]
MSDLRTRDLGLSDKNGCACCAAPAVVDDSTTATATATATGQVSASYLVEGMTCSHCVTSVAEELHDVAGVTGVDIRLVPDGASTVTVTSSAPVNPADVEHAVTEAGYRVVADL